VTLQMTELELHRRGLTGYCERMVGPAEADDAVQETMLRAWRATAQFDGRSSVRVWLYQIAANTCTDLLRRRARRGRLERRLLTTAGRAVPEDPADLAATRDSVRHALAAMFARLPARQRAALMLCEVLRWQAEEAAQLLGVSAPAVASALQRARATLAAQTTHREVDAGQLARYLEAFSRYDVAGLVTLIRAEP
jgi:RNA polymerase sigma-70 factor, ECF subfamily